MKLVNKSVYLFLIKQLLKISFSKDDHLEKEKMNE